MLTLQECKKLLPLGDTRTDSEVEALRDDLYALTEIAVDDFKKQKGGDKQK